MSSNDWPKPVDPLDVALQRSMDELDARRAMLGIPKIVPHEERMQKGKDLFTALAPPILLDKGWDAQPTEVRGVAWSVLAEHIAKTEER